MSMTFYNQRRLQEKRKQEELRKASIGAIETDSHAEEILSSSEMKGEDISLVPQEAEEKTEESTVEELAEDRETAETEEETQEDKLEETQEDKSEEIDKPEETQEEIVEEEIKPETEEIKVKAKPQTKKAANKNNKSK